jgi:hypothetical protein
LASRASAYLLAACGEADFFSAFGLVSGTEFGSELVGLIIVSPYGLSCKCNVPGAFFQRSA